MRKSRRHYTRQHVRGSRSQGIPRKR